MSWRRSTFLLGFSKKYGRMLLGVWLVLTGLIQVLGLHFDYMGLVLGILAIVAGVLVFLDR